MPNWCQNKLVIRGRPNNLKRFRGENKNYAKNEKSPAIVADNLPEEGINAELSFERHLPTPKEFKDKPSPPPGKPDGMSDLMQVLSGEKEPYDWYTWRLANWGTKWDLGDGTQVEENYEDGWIAYSFDSAWSPPIMWLMSVSEKYPLLFFRLEYEEGGNSFEGFVETSNGKELRKHEGPYTRCYECGERGCGGKCKPEGEEET
jgi:hypothetical protein